MWYTPNPLTGCIDSHACLSSYRYLTMRNVREMVFTSVVEVTPKALKHFEKAQLALYASVHTDYPKVGEYLDKLAVYDFFTYPGIEGRSVRIRPANPEKTFDKMSAKELHWVINLVRYNVEMANSYIHLYRLNLKYKTGIPAFILWLLSHRYRVTTTALYPSNSFNHTMYGEFGVTTNLPRFVGYITDIVNEDKSHPVTRDYVYWSMIKFNPENFTEQDKQLFKWIETINEDTVDKLWFSHIVPLYNLIHKHIKEDLT